MLLRHFLLSCASALQTSTMFNFLRSDCTRSCHLCFCPPWCLLPPAILLTRSCLGNRSPGILSRCLRHFNLLFWIITLTLSIFELLRWVFLIFSHRDVLVMILEHLLTKTWSLCVCFCKRFQVSLPYRRFSITALKSFNFVCTFIFGWYHTSRLRVRKACAALLIRASTSVSTELSLLSILPRYLNWVTSSK